MEQWTGVLARIGRGCARRPAVPSAYGPSSWLRRSLGITQSQAAIKTTSTWQQRRHRSHCPAHRRRGERADPWATTSEPARL